ncbi:hypothetical protein J6590_026499 [Homalodisca vitripennis]|nr:hypothetical protein J6590_026499 [Homalodisca vitripennis]
MIAQRQKAAGPCCAVRCERPTSAHCPHTAHSHTPHSTPHTGTKLPTFYHNGATQNKSAANVRLRMFGLAGDSVRRQRRLLLFKVRQTASYARGPVCSGTGTPPDYLYLDLLPNRGAAATGDEIEQAVDVNLKFFYELGTRENIASLVMQLCTLIVVVMMSILISRGNG